MAIEDFTTYTEVDTLNRLTVTANKVEYTLLQSGERADVTKDAGAGYYTDFEHLFKIEITHAPDDTSYYFVYGVANDSDIGRPEVTAMAVVIRNGGLFFIWDRNTGNTDMSLIGGIGTYYCTFNRATTTLTVYIYSDSTRTTLEDTLACVCTANAFQYNGCGSDRRGGNNTDISLTVEDLDLQEGNNSGFMDCNKYWDG